MAYRPTERTEARKAATRERILEAAMDQLAEGGYASASVQAVASRAGVATGTVYRHFPSKAELFAEVFRRASGRELAVVERLAGDGEGPASRRIAVAVEAFARRALAAPNRAYALIAEPVDPAVEAERLSFREAYRDGFVQALQAGIESGELAPHDTRTVGAALVGALGEALVDPLSPVNGNGGGGARHDEALIASLVQFAMNALPRADRRNEEEPSGRSRAHV